MPLTVQVFDPYIQMDDIITWYASADAQAADMTTTFQYWAGMATEGGEFAPGTVVTLNTDHATEPTTYYLNIAYTPEAAAEHNYPLHQTDVFHIIRTDVDGPDSDISEIGGSQCGSCGAVNAIPADVDALTPHGPIVLPEGVKPVWRQSLNTANTLCDSCADAEWNARAAS